MSKILKVTKPERCIGCGLCVLKSSLDNSGNISLSSSPIRISGKPGNFKIVIDYGAKINADKVKNICPRGCFDTEQILEN